MKRKNKMCGLVGVYGENVTNKDFDFLIQALHVDVIRGADGTGIAFLGKHSTIVKSAEDAFRFCLNEYIDHKQTMFKGGHGAIGHNRASTCGASIDKNSHPFKHGDIILAHNGTLRSRAGLMDAGDFEVDSENICHTFSKYQEDSVLPDIDGAFALSWYDTQLEEMNLIRNKERPLFIAKKKGANTYYWASEEGLLNWILTRNGIAFESLKPLEVGERVNLSFEGKGNQRKLIKTSTKIDVIDYVPKPQPHWGYGGWSNKSTVSSSVIVGANKVESVSTVGNPHGLQSGDYVCVDITASSIKAYAGKNSHTTGFAETTTLSGMPCEIHGIDIDLPAGKYTAKISCIEPMKWNEKNAMDMVYAYSPNLVPIKATPTTVRAVTIKEVSPVVEDAVYTDYHQGTLHCTWDSLNYEYITEKMFNNKAKDGCCYCSADVFPEEAEQIMWLDSVSPVCEDCQLSEAWQEDRTDLNNNQYDNDIPF
jgi:predicted glutamine amidotransferase